MTDKNLTPSQRKAVQSNNAGSILVSASAGSGKTSVLVDRVVHKLLTDSIGIDNLLVLTFTNAAAKEMKDRIRKKLREQLNQVDSQSRQASFIIQQLHKLPTANVSTLDSFCQRVVQKYYYVIGLDPSFRVLTDSVEINMLRDLVWQKVREDLYANDSDGKFADLVTNFSNRDSDDDFTTLVYQLYDYAMVQADSEDWLKHLPDAYQVGDSITKSSFYKRHFVKILADQFDRALLDYRQAYRWANDASLTDDTQRLAWEMNRVKDLKANLKKLSWNDLRNQILNFSFHSFRFPKYTKDPQIKGLQDKIRTERKSGYDRIHNKKKPLYKIFSIDEATNLKAMQKAHGLVQELVIVIKKFTEAYREAKRARNSMEFIDIEHAALNILRKDNSEGRAVRKNLQTQFNEILVDECQDDNRLQDRLLSTIARLGKDQKPRNMFMVGDVKQSIYRFRLADPQIFIERARDYEHPNNDHLKLTLARNFRSTVNVDRFVNLIFTQIMGADFGGIDYSNEKLEFGAKNYEGTPQNKCPVQILLYDANGSKAKSSKVPSRVPGSNEPVDASFHIDSSAQGQIEIMARKIQQLVKKDHYHYQDIALIASTRNDNLVISDVFHHYGIPLVIDGSPDYFKTTEIQIMVALLKIIDNPYQDIPLVAVLRSPIVDLNDDQLAYLRINANTGDYFHAVLKFISDYEHGNVQASSFSDRIYRSVKKFLQDLDEFQTVAKRHGLVDLIWYIYQTTGFLDYVGGMPAGKQRQANLHALYERAADYEASSFHGLFKFVRFIRLAQNRNDDLAQAPAEHAVDAVHVMTIHGSKGLEAPVVFFYDVSRQFNLQDTRGNYVLNNRYGIGIKTLNPQNVKGFDPKYHERIPTLQHFLITDVEQKQTRAEEMRKMYVAMTRAEQRLFIVGATKRSNQTKLIDNWMKKSSGSNLLLDPTSRRNAKNYLDWIGPALVRHPAFTSYGTQTSFKGLEHDSTRFKLTFYTKDDLAKTVPQPEKEASDSERPKLRPLYAKKFDQVMNFKYPHPLATKLANYQSVSSIRQQFDDPDNQEMSPYNQLKKQRTDRFISANFTQPQFMTAPQTRKPSATDVGTATHLVLELIDLHQQPTVTIVNKLIHRLVTNNLIPKTVAPYIDRQNVVSFFASSFGQKVLARPQAYYRETPFSLLVDAGWLYPDLKRRSQDSKKILVHGIIDGYLKWNGHVYLVDYKTDYVDTKNPRLWIKKIVQRYRSQLRLYARALQSVTGSVVHHKYLYLLSIRKLIPVK